jgi:hypothetical protein
VYYYRLTNYRKTFKFLFSCKHLSATNEN